MLPNLVLYEEEFNLVTDVIKRLVSSANAKVVFLVDKNGQLITLASLTAGNIAATGGLAKLIGEKEFSILFHEGEKDNIHISIIGHRVILVVIFDEKSSLGLVRLRVKKSGEELEKLFAEIDQKAGTDTSGLGVDSPFAEITDDDIENLFS